jgi:hypothetical protein
MSSAFEHWVYTPKAIKHPEFPMLTEILYSVCNNDEEKFNLLMEYLEITFDAGYVQGQCDWITEANK